MAGIPGMLTYLIAVDLGQVADYTAIAVAERTEIQTGRMEVHSNVAAYFAGGERLPRQIERPQVAGQYDLIDLQRLDLGTPYTELPDRLRALDQFVRRRWCDLVFARTERAGYLTDAPVELVIDMTGCGRPVFDFLQEADLDPVGVTITGGDTVVRVDRREYRVPKRDLVGAVQVALQNRRLRWAKKLREAAVLQAELANFRVKVSLSGHDSYAAGVGEEWRIGAHDDLVLAVALAVWYGEQRPTTGGGWGSWLPSAEDETGRVPARA
jgi:hypothetical protein